MSGSELIEVADKLDRLHSAFEETHADTLREVAGATKPFVRAWSGSNIGFHSCVYYNGFQAPPPGARFSSEWGFLSRFNDATAGDWSEYRYDDVISEVYRHAGNPDLSTVREASQKLESEVEAARAEIISNLTIAIGEHDADAYLRQLHDKAAEVRFRSVTEFGQAVLPSGQLITRDTTALGQGIRAAPHQYVAADMAALNQASLYAKDLAEVARQAGSHLIRLDRRTRRSQLVGTNVFIGHGRAPAWRVLKDFIKDRLGLPYDEFNRVPVAGITNITRLSEMLDAAAVAFLILTAEDEQASGKLQARMNVIHEVGLFQGRLGFTRAIVLLEEGCEEFTNIQGLGQIRFPKDNIAAAFEEVRLVLEREGVLSN